MRSRVQVSLPLPENQGVTMIRSSFFLFPADNLHTGPAISATSPHRRSHGLPHPEADPTRTHPRASTQPYPRKHPGNPVLILFPHGMPFCPLRPDTLPLQPEPPDQHNPPHSTRPTCAAPFRPPGIKIPTIRTEEFNQAPLFPATRGQNGENTNTLHEIPETGFPDK